MRESNDQIYTYFPTQSGEGDQVSAEKLGVEAGEITGNKAVEYTKEDETRLLAKYREATEKGLNGLVHLVNYDSFTANPLTQSLPSELISEGYYNRIFICSREDLVAGKDKDRQLMEGDIEIYVADDGSISTEDQEKLDNALKDRVGIIAGGGGKGDVDTPRALPILKALERALDVQTPAAGICLGHQYLWTILREWERRDPQDPSVQRGYLEAGLAFEKLTEEGKNHPVFQRLGDQLTIVSFNELHAVFPGDLKDKNHLPFGRVLTRNTATNSPTSLSLDFASPSQAITTQRHPEVGIQGTEELFLVEEKRYALPSGQEIILPVGTHPDLTILAWFLSANFQSVSQKFKITEEDAINIFRSGNITPNLGKNFYGPLTEYLVDIRLKQ